MFSGYDGIPVEKQIKANFNICQENIFLMQSKNFTFQGYYNILIEKKMIANFDVRQENVEKL